MSSTRPVEAQQGNAVKIFTATASSTEASELKAMLSGDALERLTVISGRDSRPGEAWRAI